MNRFINCDELFVINQRFPNMKESLAAAVARPVSPIYTALSEIMQINISAVLLGNMTVEDAVITMEQQMNEKLIEYNH